MQKQEFYQCHLKIEALKQKALEVGLTRDDVRKFGTLTRRETWEKAIAFRAATTRESDRWKEIEPVDNIIHTEPRFLRIQSILNIPQLFALFLAAVGFFVLVGPALRKIPSPFPIRVNIQIGASK